jgi:hypothetical protein
LRTRDKLQARLDAAGCNDDNSSELLRMFRDAVQAGRVPDPRIMDYLAAVFDDMVNSKPASGALHPRGMRGRADTGREMASTLRLAAEVIDTMESCVTYREASTLVSEKYRIPESATRKAYENYHRVIRDRLAYEQREARSNSQVPPESACELLDQWLRTF